MPNADRLEAEVDVEYGARLNRALEPGQHVLVLGHSASGKSTTAKAAATMRGLRYVYDSALLESARFQHYTDRLFGQADFHAFMPYEVEALLVRFLQNRHPAGDWICDQGVHSILAYSRARHALGELDNHIYQTIYALFLTLAAESPTPRLVVRFRCAPLEARRRLETRGRPHETTSLTVPFIEELDQAYTHILAKFPPAPAIEVIETTGVSKSAVVHRFLTLIDAHSTP